MYREIETSRKHMRSDYVSQGVVFACNRFHVTESEAKPIVDKMYDYFFRDNEYHHCLFNFMNFVNQKYLLFR